MMVRTWMMFFVFGAAAMAAADELEADWIAQDGAVPTNVTHEAWRAEMLARRVSPPFNHLAIPHQLEPKYLNGNMKDRNGRWVADPYAKNGYVNWVSSASEPTLIPPLTYGSRTSRLFTERLDKGHAKGITDAEKRVLACWVDLCVPFCGDYEEGAAWNEQERAFWDYYTKKRAEFATDAERVNTGFGN